MIEIFNLRVGVFLEWAKMYFSELFLKKLPRKF